MPEALKRCVERVYPTKSRAGILSFVTWYAKLDDSLFGGHPLHDRVFRSIFGLYPLHANSTTAQSVKTKNVSSGGQKSHLPANREPLVYTEKQKYDVINLGKLCVYRLIKWFKAGIGQHSLYVSSIHTLLAQNWANPKSLICRIFVCLPLFLQHLSLLCFISGPFHSPLWLFFLYLLLTFVFYKALPLTLHSAFLSLNFTYQAGHSGSCL